MLRHKRSWSKKLLQGVNSSKAIGPDMLPIRVFKEAAPVIAPFFFHQSNDTGSLPSDWKYASHFATRTYGTNEG